MPSACRRAAGPAVDMTIAHRPRDDNRSAGTVGARQRWTSAGSDLHAARL